MDREAATEEFCCSRKRERACCSNASAEEDVGRVLLLTHGWGCWLATTHGGLTLPRWSHLTLTVRLDWQSDNMGGHPCVTLIGPSYHSSLHSLLKQPCLTFNHHTSLFSCCDDQCPLTITVLPLCTNTVGPTAMNETDIDIDLRSFLALRIFSQVQTKLTNCPDLS